MTDLPYLDHIDQSEFQYIYEPSDDTFLLMDTLYSDIPQIMAESPSICLEIGSGSGCISAVFVDGWWLREAPHTATHTPPHYSTYSPRTPHSVKSPETHLPVG